MGMRRNIELCYNEGGKVYLYTHWDADGLEITLAKSLERSRDRWGDESYLARVIFTDMTKDHNDDITNYGLAPYVMNDEYPTLVVDLKKLAVNDVPFEDFLKNPHMFKI